jgi:hypothetical protein
MYEKCSSALERFYPSLNGRRRCISLENYISDERG